MLSLITFLIVLSVLIVVHEFGHFFVAKKSGVKVERFSIGFGPKIFGFKKGGTEYMVCAIPLGGYVKMAGESVSEGLTGKKWEFLSQPIGKRFNIVVAGSVTNYILAFLIFSFIFMIGNTVAGTKVGELLDGYPAKRVGILKNDKIVAIDGKPIKYWEDLRSIVQKTMDGELTLTIERRNKTIYKKIRPKVQESKNIFGQEIKAGFIGIKPSSEPEVMRFNPPRAFYEGGKKLFRLTGLTYKGLWLIVTGGVSFRDAGTGPIGIYVLTGEVAKYGLMAVIHFIGFISFNLAIFNLLPLPILDGGHIFFLGLEKLRGKALSERAQEMITNIGLTFIILLFIVISYNDIMKFQIIDKVKDLFTK